MSLHPDQFKRIVEKGESVIFKGNVVNKDSEFGIPSAVDLVDNDTVRNQIKVDIDLQVAELLKQKKEIEAAEKAKAEEAKAQEAEAAEQEAADASDGEPPAVESAPASSDNPKGPFKPAASKAK